MLARFGLCEGKPRQVLATELARRGHRRDCDLAVTARRREVNTARRTPVRPVAGARGTGPARNLDRGRAHPAGVQRMLGQHESRTSDEQEFLMAMQQMEQKVETQLAEAAGSLSDSR